MTTEAFSGRDLRLLLTIALLYVTQGIPLGLAMETLPTLLRQDGASLRVLAFAPLVGLPWICKFLCASQVDNHWLPRLGKRRSWIIPMQFIVLLCLIGVAIIGLSSATAFAAAGLFALASLASATQDTATDGLTAENFSGNMLARANAVQVGGTMIGFFTGGAGCLIVTGLFGRTIGILAVAAIVAAGLVLIILWREPLVQAVPSERRRASLANVIRRPGAWLVLTIALLTAMGASATFGLFKLFLVDQGWPIARIGMLGLAGGGATIILGCGGSAWLIARVGLKPVLLASVAALISSAAIWAILAVLNIPATLPVAAVAVVAGSIGSGGASVGAMTLGMRFAQNGAQAGTDMTAVQSSRDVGELGASSLAAALAGSMGYGAAFLGSIGLCAATFVTVSLWLRIDQDGMQ